MTFLSNDQNGAEFLGEGKVDRNSELGVGNLATPPAHRSHGSAAATNSCRHSGRLSRQWSSTGSTAASSSGLRSPSRCASCCGTSSIGTAPGCSRRQSCSPKQLNQLQFLDMRIDNGNSSRVHLPNRCQQRRDEPQVLLGGVNLLD
ncbi:MAG: hypothetical protein CMJ68_11155 [Planctomycetaceae bacterium]|nr:hypothetical protein [Planctomycetaceae bacterium]